MRTQSPLILQLSDSALARLRRGSFAQRFRGVALLGMVVATTLPSLACSIVGSSAPPGLLFSNVRGVHEAARLEATGDRPGPKQGKSCAMGILGLASWGDMSLDRAKKNGNITHVDTIDFESFSILGVLYMKNCTVVTGR